MTDLVDQPDPGFYLLQLGRYQPKVPARIFWGPPLDPKTLEELDRPHVLRAEIAGERNHDPFTVWHCKRRWIITEQEYQYRMDVITWALQNAPQQPETKPKQAIDMKHLPPMARLYR